MFDGLARAIQAYRPGRPDSGWFFAGLASSFPNIDNSHDGALAEKDIPAPCEAAVGSTTASIPACKVFRVPLPEGPRGNAEAEVVPLTEAAEEGADLRNQVLVFQYRGKFHAVDHVSPFQLPFSFISFVFHLKVSHKQVWNVHVRLFFFSWYKLPTDVNQSNVHIRPSPSREDPLLTLRILE
ncbi:hypothetical protein ACKVV1_011182 [Pyricularia oryzae]